MPDEFFLRLESKSKLSRVQFGAGSRLSKDMISLVCSAPGFPNGVSSRSDSPETPLVGGAPEAS